MSPSIVVQSVRLSTAIFVRCALPRSYRPNSCEVGIITVKYEWKTRIP